MPGTSSGYYIIEIDGVSAARASEVSGLNIKHDPFKIGVGDRPNPILGRSKYEIDEVTVKHAHALNNTGRELSGYIVAYCRGLRTDKLNCRLLQMAEDGFGIEAVWEMIECVPTSFSQDTNKGDSNDAAYFTFKFKPTDAYMI